MVHINEILTLDIDKRIEIAGLIWDSVEKESTVDLSIEMKRILDSRLDDLSQNPNASASWNDVYNRLKNGN